MSNGLISHGGGVPLGASITDAGVKLLTTDSTYKYVVITNPSAVGVYIAYNTSTDGTTCTAEVNKGIYLAPEVGVAELNNVNMYFGEIWAITAAGTTADVCIQVGR
jgi:hypothetical protein